MRRAELSILVVDDEAGIRLFLRLALTGEGFSITEAANGQEALQILVNEHPGLVLLDLGLPDMDGVEVLQKVRQWSQVPVIVLSVRDREREKIAALNAGADDYLTKPFGVGELLARIRTVLRRQAGTTEPVITLGGLKIDLPNRLVTVDDREVQLTPTEYDLLRTLATLSGKVLTNRQLLHQVWGEGYEDIRILRVNISNLRRKIEPIPSRPTYLHTESGVGYRLSIKRQAEPNL